MQITEQDLQLIEKYNRPGPRYTSYPPANHFRDYEDPAPLLRSVEKGDAPLSLYFHLPFCETLCWFCGCTMIPTLDHDRATDYLDLLERELELFAKHHQREREAVQMHFGGGTPNFFGPEQIDPAVDPRPCRGLCPDGADPRVFWRAGLQPRGAKSNPPRAAAGGECRRDGHPAGERL